MPYRRKKLTFAISSPGEFLYNILITVFVKHSNKKARILSAKLETFQSTRMQDKSLHCQADKRTHADIEQQQQQQPLSCCLLDAELRRQATSACQSSDVMGKIITESFLLHLSSHRLRLGYDCVGPYKRLLGTPPPSQ